MASISLEKQISMIITDTFYKMFERRKVDIMKDQEMIQNMILPVDTVLSLECNKNDCFAKKFKTYCDEMCGECKECTCWFKSTMETFYNHVNDILSEALELTDVASYNYIHKCLDLCLFIKYVSLHGWNSANNTVTTTNETLCI